MTAATFQRGYIISQKSDLTWFVLMPLVAVGVANFSEMHLSDIGVAIAAWGLTVPHHYATWVRVYGSPSEFNRFPIRFLAGPLIFIPGVFLLLKYAPLGLVTLVFLWDNQHSIMQQYGFGRVYDFKAETGDTTTARFDFYLHWILFINMLIVSPVFGRRWPGMLQAWDISVTEGFVENAYTFSWTVTGVYVAVYAGYMIWRLRNGRALNPAKYEFLFASYFLWYFAAFSTTSVLVWSVAHRIMHGGQYILMVYYFNRNTVERTGGDSPFSRLVGSIGPSHVAMFVLLGLGYSFFFRQLSLERGISEDWDLLAASLISSFSLLHYYFDSFIWKVRKPEIQESL